jgi:hypothetical protein
MNRNIVNQTHEELAAQVRDVVFALVLHAHAHTQTHTHIYTNTHEL